MLQNLTIRTTADVPEGRGAVGTAFRERHAVILNDFGASEMTASWHEVAKKYRLMAVATFPIMRGGKSYAVLSVYSAQIGAFDDEIVGLLSELAANVSFALDNLDRESKRRQAEMALRLSESRLRLVADEAPLPMIVYAEDWEVLQVNHAWTDITGYSFVDIPTVDVWTEKAYGEEAAGVLAAIRRLFEAQKRQDGGERVIRCKDGSLRIWRFISSPLGRLPDGRLYVISMAVDVTESKAAEKELRFAAKVFEGNHDNIMLTDADGTIVSVNPAFTAVTGYSIEDVIGKNPSILSSGVHDAGFFRQFWDTILSTGYWQGEIWNKRKNGEDYLAWLSVTAVRDDKGVITNYIGIADDITESRKNKSQAEFLAYFDSLTRLPNRQLARDRMEQALGHADRMKSKVALIYLDLDNFRVINDTLGHFVGDRLLAEFAGRLSAAMRESDTVSRQGGDEFLVMLPDILNLDAIKNVAAEILEMAGKPFHIDRHDLSISTSIGIAIYPDDGKDVDTLLKNADLAMYNAKQSGRNTFRFFSEDMNTLVEEHLRIRNDLTRALEHNEFRLHYQPQIDLSSGTVSGAEALIRWQHPDLGMLSPDRFIQIAEDSGMIVQIGSWVLREACRQMVEWQKAGLSDFVVAVNISALQFRRGDFDQVVAASLEEFGLAPRHLELELTESILIQDSERSLEAVRRFEQLGVRMSIDDFGTGYSSLSYLQRLPVDKLKIDQSFTRQMMTNPSDATIAVSIISLAHALGKTVIAEGVENEEQLAFLRQHGCDKIQGYYFSRPLLQADFEVFLKGWTALPAASSH